MSEANINETALAAVIALGQKIGQPVTSEKIHFAVVPTTNGGASLVSLKEYQFPEGIPPSRRRGTVTLYDAPSFAAFVNLFNDERTRTFADPATVSFLSVLDYHGAGSAADHAAEFCDFRAKLTLKTSEQWNIWSGKNEKAFAQTEFAEFIEDNTKDIFDPTAAVMLEVARDLQAKTEVNFASSTVLQSGQVQLKYTETIQAGVGAGNVEIPTAFKIRIPVFYGEEPAEISARLRFRLSQGKVTFHYKLYRPVETLNDAFNKAVGSIGDLLKTEVLLGTPGN
jgi:uncharacterized protein YfdQ (DUF2303 family)